MRRFDIKKSYKHEPIEIDILGSCFWYYVSNSTNSAQK